MFVTTVNCGATFQVYNIHNYDFYYLIKSIDGIFEVQLLASIIASATFGHSE